MEAEETPDQVNKTSRNSEQTKVSEAVNWGDEPPATAGGEKDVEEGKKALEGGFVIDISRNSGNSKEAEKVCRICHFSEDSELLLLGCDCRGELGVAHRDCAEAWFLQKGNRLCEICGKTAKNVRSNNEEDATAFMIEWNEMRLVAATLDASEESSRRCKQSFCNLLLGCLLLAFVLPWLLRAIDML